MIKQRRIDNGQLGAIINTIAGSSYIFGIVTYVNSAIIVYTLVFKYYLSIYWYAVLSFIGFSLWVYLNYVFTAPSQIQFIQDQAWKWGSPIRTEFENQKVILNRIENKLEEVK